MKFSLIICTLGEREKEFKRLIESLQNQTYPQFEIVVVSQALHEEVEELLIGSGLTYLHIKTDKRGLSRARNLGLEQSTGDYITISDDDCWYPADALEKVHRHCTDDYKDVGVLCFQIYDPLSSQFYKNYGKEGQFLDVKKIGSRSSIEIFYRNNAINKTVRFDENFGLGARYPSGEENIFLADMIKKSNRIVYIPEVVVYHKARKAGTVIFTPSKMQTAYYMFKRVFGDFKGIAIYYVYYAKHFSKIEKKLSSFFLNF